MTSAAFLKRIDLWRQLGAPLSATGGLPLQSVAFSPDGRTLAAVGSDTVWLWDVATHTQLGVPLSSTGGIAGIVAFSADGRTLAAVSNYGTVWLWSGFLWRDFADLRGQVCSLVWNGLSRTEWAQDAPGIAYQHTCP